MASTTADALAGRYGPDVHCEYVIDFMERHRSRPFFAYYPTNLVHAPFDPTPDSRETFLTLGSLLF